MKLSPYTNEKPLSEEELQLLAALVESPVYGALRRLLNIQRGDLFSQIVSSKPELIPGLQGEIRGLNLVENLPILMKEQYDRLKAKQKTRVSSPSRGSAAGRASSPAS